MDWKLALCLSHHNQKQKNWGSEWMFELMAELPFHALLLPQTINKDKFKEIQIFLNCTFFLSYEIHFYCYCFNLSKNNFKIIKFNGCQFTLFLWSCMVPQRRAQDLEWESIWEWNNHNITFWGLKGSFRVDQLFRGSAHRCRWHFR